MFRRPFRCRLSALTLLGFLAMVLGFVTPSAAANAATGGSGHTVTITQNFHGTHSFSDFNPCTGNPVNIVSSSNSVMHETYFPAGDEAWGTFTEEDNFTATDTVTRVVLTGHATFWGNFNVNERNSNTTFTSTIIASGSDGSRIKAQEVSHLTYNGNGVITVSFDKPRLSC